MIGGTNYHKLGDLKGQEFIFSQIWRPEIRNQGLSRDALIQEAWGWEGGRVWFLLFHLSLEVFHSSLCHLVTLPSLLSEFQTPLCLILCLHVSHRDNFRQHVLSKSYESSL